MGRPSRPGAIVDPTNDRRPTLSQQRPAPSQKPTRRQRREAERQAQRLPTGGAAARPFWQSPMVLLTGAAAIVAVIIIAFAMLSTGQISTADLRTPTDPTPEGVWDGRAVGSADALTLAVYSDFQCPACDAFATQSEPQLIRDYVEPGRLRIVYKDYAFIGPESFDAAVAARCAGDQGLFWPYHDYLFANQKGENEGAFDRNRLIAIGEAVGVDQAAFQACLDAQPPLEATKAETDDGVALGVTSTPTLFLGDQKIVGVPAYETLAGAIESALAGASPAPSSAP
jgi:protein-disulfide isomerase